MISLPQCTRSIFACCYLVALVGCGGTPQTDVALQSEPAENYYIGDRAVYALLQEGSGGSWILGTVDTSDSPPEHGYLIRVNDLTPAFDRRVAECEPQAYPTNHKCNPTQPFREKQVSVMGKIISGGIAAGTAGKVKDISRTYKTSFDEAAFNQAVDEALINTGLGDQRRDFLAALERYDTLLQSGRTDLTELREGALSRYQNTADLTLAIRPTVTGLTEYYSADIEFRDLVEVEPRSTLAPEMAELEQESILPCDARHCATVANNAIQTLSATIERAKSSVNTTIVEETSDYALRCEKTSHAGYSFVLECPDTLSVAGARTEPVPVTINILSRDFHDVYPEINISDENLSIDISGGNVRFKNETASYLSVSAQTVYYNSQVQTNAERIDIAPSVTIERAIDDFVTPQIRIEASYLKMTPDKAGGATFRFGFGARYRLAEAVEETTLYDLRDFNVGCVINNRVRPGSCRNTVRDTVQHTVPDISDDE